MVAIASVWTRTGFGRPLEFRSNFDDESGLSLWGIAKELSFLDEVCPMHGLSRQASFRQD